MSAEEQNDPWREQFDTLLSELREDVDSTFAQWIEAEDADSITAAALAFSVESGVDRSRVGIGRIEAWFRKQHDAAVNEVGKANGVNPNKWLMAQERWIERDVRHCQMALQRALSEYKIAISDYASFIEENSGVIGFAKNFARGWLNPVDGLAELFGEGSASREAKAHAAHVSSAAQAYESAIVELLEAINEAVVTRWNEKTIGCLEEIEELARRRTEVPAAAQNPPAYVPAPLVSSPIVMSPLWGFLIGGIVAGAVVLGGIVALRHFGFL